MPRKPNTTKPPKSGATQNEIPPEQRKAVSVATAAALLDCGLTTIRERIYSGDIRVIRIGQDPRIPQSEIRRILKRGLPKLTVKPKVAA